MDKRWRFRWQVIRIWHDGGVSVLCSHRSMHRADLCAFRRDVWAVASHRTSPIPYDHDVRLRPDMSTTI